MSKKSEDGNSNMLLFGALGIGAALLFANKGGAQTKAPAVDMPAGGDGSDIPVAPKILAVNQSSTESPTPTGIVSDEEGMEATSGGSSSSGSLQPSYGSSSSTSASSSYDSSDGDQESSGSGASPLVKATASAGLDVIRKAQEYNEIPGIISTTLTAKEKDIIDKGKLTAALAIKRPDLYKAAYIKRYGGKTQAGKRQALSKAMLAIDAAVNAAATAKSGGVAKAQQYPAKPEFTFVQSAGGMAAQMALTQMQALDRAGLKVSPAAQKVSAQVKAAKKLRGKHPVKAAHGKAAHPTTHHAPTHKKAAIATHHPAAKKHAVKKHR